MPESLSRLSPQVHAGPRRTIVASRSAIDAAFEVVTWIGTAVTLAALLILASTVSATVDARPAPTDVVTTGR